MATSRIHPAYALYCRETDETPSADGERNWAVHMLAEWRRTSLRFARRPLGTADSPLSSTREMTHQDHRHFAAWMEQAS